MQLTITEKNATLDTRATPAVLAVLPSLEGRRTWLKEGGLRIEATPHNVNTIAVRLGAEIVDLRTPDPIDAAVAEAFDHAADAVAYTPKTKPLPHQDRALDKFRGMRFFGLFAEQGTGKSKIQIDWMGDLYARGLITGVIVVSKKGPHRQWIESEIPRHLNVPFSGVFWPWKSATFEPGTLEVAAFNYDGIKTPKGLAAAMEFAERHKGKLAIIADESQDIKNHRSARYGAMMEIRPFSAFRTLSTGTPVAVDLTDEWAQLQWLDPEILGIKYVTAFRAQYCVMGGFEGRVVVGHKNWAEFRSRVDPVTFRATKDELGILPKQYREWRFDLLPVQLRAIASLKKTLLAEVESGEITAQNAAVAASKFQQIASGFYIDEEGEPVRLMPWDKNPRVIALREWLDLKEDRKAIVWCRFREDYRIVADALRGWGEAFVEYHGGVKDKDRKAAIDSFLTPAGARIFLANAQSAGTGLNLQGLCQDAAYYSHSDNAIDRWQSEDRIHRIGTVGSCEYTDFIGKGSYDQRILNRTARKARTAELATSVADDVMAFIRGEIDPVLDEAPIDEPGADTFAEDF